MKLKLPFALLAALFVCLNGAMAEETTVPDITPEEGTTGELPPLVNDEKGYTSFKDSNDNPDDGSTQYYYLTQQATYTESHEYYDNGHATVLCVGAVGGEGSLYVQGQDTVVRTGGHLFVGGWGYGNSTASSPQNGYVYVGQGATLMTGAHPDIYGTDLAQLNVDGGRTGDVVGKGTMLVDGGTVIANGALNVGLSNGADSLLTVQNGGEVVLHVPDNMKYGDPGFLTIGYSTTSHGEMVVDHSSFKITSTETRAVAAQVYIGLYGTGSLDISNGSEVDLTTGYGRERTYVGTYNAGSISVEDSTLNMGNTYLGYAADASLSATMGAEVNIEGTTYLGCNGGDGTMTVSEKSTVHCGGQVLLGGWKDSTGELMISSGGTVVADADVILGYTSGTQGIVTVEGTGSSLSAMADVTYVGCEGKGELNVRNGAEAMLGTVAVSGPGSSVSVTEGAAVLVIGDMMVGADATVTVKDGDSAASGLGVQGTYMNNGTTTLELTQGGAFVANGGVENTGIMNIMLDNEGALSVASFVNEGEVTISAEAGTTCDLGALELRSGSMTLEGEGEFTMGTQASVTEFTVTGTSVETATTTCIDISSLGSGNFTIDTTAEFTFRFTDEILAALYASAADATDLELTVIKGFVGFALEQQQLEELLENTTYLYGSEAAAVTFALEGDSPQYSGIVRNAAYKMVGNGLVWTGSVEVVPEPAATTLSLLALAGLAARRRRK